MRKNRNEIVKRHNRNKFKKTIERRHWEPKKIRNKNEVEIPWSLEDLHKLMRKDASEQRGRKL